MRRDLLLLEQMIEAADQAVALVEGVGIKDLAADRIRRDALLWNFTILGEASAQLSAEVTEQFTDVAWRQPATIAQSHRAWLLVDRSGHRAHHRTRAMTWVRRRPRARACRHYPTQWVRRSGK